MKYLSLPHQDNITESAVKMELSEIPRFDKTYTYGDNDVYLANGIHLTQHYSISSTGRNVIFAMCCSGNARISINDTAINIKTGDFFFIRPSSVITVSHASSGFNAYVIAVSRRFSQKDLFHKTIPLSSILTIISRHPYFHLNSEGIRYFKSLYNIIAQTISLNFDQFAEEVIYHHIAAFSSWFSGIISKQLGLEPTKLRYSDILFRKFTELIPQHLHEHHDLKFYADTLCISPKHLSYITLKAVNISGFKWISHIIINEAKAMLRTSPLSIAQIAGKLGFDDASNFCKYFKKMTGITPSDYRSL